MYSLVDLVLPIFYLTNMHYQSEQAFVFMNNCKPLYSDQILPVVKIAINLPIHIPIP